MIAWRHRLPRVVEVRHPETGFPTTKVIHITKWGYLWERISDRFWSALAAFDKWLYWQIRSMKEKQ